MSLINDALKRAKEAQRENTPSGVSPMRPVEVKRQERDFSLVLPVVIIFLIVAAFLFIGLAMARHTINNTDKKIAVAPTMTVSQPVAAAVAPAANPPPAVLPATNPPAPAAPVSAPAPPAEVVSPPAILTEPPKPTLVQGIAYDPVHPWAIINGKTVYVGDFVNGLRVAAISRNSVTLVGNGQTNALVVGQQ